MTKVGWVFIGVVALVFLYVIAVRFMGDGDIIPTEPAGEVHEGIDSTGAN